MTLQRSDSVVTATLSGELAIGDAAALYDQLFAALDLNVSLVINAEGATRMDASVAQLFVFASRCVHDLRVVTHSVAWDEALTLLGISPALTSSQPVGLSNHA